MALLLTPSLKEEYEKLFTNCSITPARLTDLESIINKIILNKNRYKSVGDKLSIPWYFIGVIHNMESSLNFAKHLHNGDPLTGRTKNVPKGRPLTGNPPFTWEESAEDALRLQKLHQWKDWSLSGILFKLELYNGAGYRLKHPHVLTPYLWSYSSHYKAGKYVADGTWSETAVSKQCGAAVILRRMAEKGEITLPVNPTGPVPTGDAGVTLLKYSNIKIPYGKELQIFLNQFPGIFLNTDGAPGEKTSNAVKKVFGFYLKGDPRDTN
jgi:lysozyme family protein